MSDTSEPTPATSTATADEPAAPDAGGPAVGRPRFGGWGRRAARPAPSGPLPPGAQRRRELRQQRRSEALRNLWRLLVFSAIAGGVGYGLLRQGWMLNNPAQLEVRGSAVVGRDQVITAADLQLPQPLLGINPSELSSRLSASLPVEQVRVTRLMLPPRLRVELVDREAVARADRRTAGGLEQGYVDRFGNWIHAGQQQGLRVRGSTRLLVSGWNERHREAVSELLLAEPRFGGGLEAIRFDPGGSLWLSIRQLGDVRLGPLDSRLQQRLAVAEHLQSSLPAQLKGRRPRLIDLSDPDQPEFSLPGAGASPGDLRPGAGPVPRGAQ
ncbi:MAG: FtsQ-type POTRA domain-containing protein [Synechococcaceae cyanobacterium]|nr:FtsQ-type POTRA domain-containing protein [Synechococcaceae cyanobacterium]